MFTRGDFWGMTERCPSLLALTYATPEGVERTLNRMPLSPEPAIISLMLQCEPGQSFKWGNDRAIIVVEYRLASP